MMYEWTAFETKYGKFEYRLEHDTVFGAPWEENDGHGPVSDWCTRSKRPGERVLCRDGISYQYYDWEGAMKRARAEGWRAAQDVGRTDLTPGQIASRAVQADFDRLLAWCTGDWCYVTVFVRMCDDYGDPMPDCEEPGCCGVESDSGDYILEVAKELSRELP